MNHIEKARAVEATERNVRLIRVYLQARGPALAETIRVDIPGSNFGDGSQQLNNALTEVIREEILPLCQRALALIEERAAARVATLEGRELDPPEPAGTEGEAGGNAPGRVPQAGRGRGSAGAAA